ncbi:aminopeptidase N-like [Phlebotomus argentipes]|uniref:aminopeptidase N-like n=1 Tax=Phlebotomus argentipes TaxID=94469 RepID=UPI0028932202|nr:aminopeptidase N-like [Phlebotomus argentipes]
MTVRIPLFFLMLMLTPLIANQTESDRDSAISSRLSNTTEPVAYELWLETRIHERILDYTGRVRIVLRALEAANVITINSENLLIKNFSLYDHLNNNVKITYEDYKRQAILAFFLDEHLRIGQSYVLDIEFMGVLQSIPRGFCYTRYVDEHGEIFYVATSFLHVTNARIAFPCYDEPRFRTTFKIHITHHPSMIAASNMPVAMIRNNSDISVTTSFQESVTMSVNLVAFTVCNYVSVKHFLEEKNLEVSFTVPRHFANEVDFAKDVIISVISKFEEYIGIGYNLPKLESVVVNDLMHNGLENWGLMVYDSKSLLYNKSLTTTSQKMEIGRTICHQLSHNYFGNLVGISWWNYAWLTEGFANYHEYLFTNYYLEEFPLNEMFVTEFMQKNFVENSYLMSNSLNKYVETRKEIEDAFDFGMVSKASGVIRMTDHMFGKKVFQKGLQKYVKDMAFKVAQPKDLYRCIQEAVNEDAVLEKINVESILSTWTDQPGFPLLTVMRNYQTNEIVVNQQRFLAARDEFDLERISWYIPLSFTTAQHPDMNNTQPSAWLKQGMRELVIRTSDNQTWTSDDWVLFNIQQTGYYRVNYDNHNWKLLANDLYKGAPYTIGLLNRAQLIDDSFNLAYSDIIQFSVALDIIKYMKYENEYSVWITAYRHLLTMIRRLEGPSYELYFGRFLQHLTETHFEKLDVFENLHGKDSVRNTFLRPIIVDLACRSGLGKCLTATRTMVTAEALTGHVLTPLEKPSVYYCHGLKNADEKTFQYFWKKLNSLTNEQERIHITTSIGCYHNFDSLYSLLLETANPHLVDVFYTNLERFQILVNTVRNGHLRVVLRFLRENHDDISRTYTYNIRMEQALKDIAACMPEETQQEFADVLQVLLKAGHINTNLVERCMIEMELHRTWMNENQMKIENWIKEYFRPALQSSGVMSVICFPLLLIAVEQTLFRVF